MGKGLDEFISIGSDILGLIPGLQIAPILGNALAGGLEGGPLGALEGGATSFAGGEIGKGLGGLVDSATGASTAALDAADGGFGLGMNPGGFGSTGTTAAATAGSEIGQAAPSALDPLAKSAGNAIAQQVIEPGLASVLGLNPAATPPPAQSQSAPKTSGSGGAGPGAPPGGLGINGSTAPPIYPWAGSASPLNQALSTISSGGATPAQPQEGAGI